MTIIRRHKSADGWRSATYSDCDRYRYSLSVSWQVDGRRLLYVMLNPSKATELANDPTIERCERRARLLGYGSMEIVNLFALRETSPSRLKSARKPEGVDNMAHVRNAAETTDEILLAWGVHGTHLRQAEKVLPILLAAGKPVLHLGKTKEGHPRHPLYVSYKTLPSGW